MHLLWALWYYFALCVFPLVRNIPLLYTLMENYKSRFHGNVEFQRSLIFSCLFISGYLVYSQNNQDFFLLRPFRFILTCHFSNLMNLRRHFLTPWHSWMYIFCVHKVITWCHKFDSHRANNVYSVWVRVGKSHIYEITHIWNTATKCMQHIQLSSSPKV